MKAFYKFIFILVVLFDFAGSHAVQQVGSNPMHTCAFINCGTSSTEIGDNKDYTVNFVEVTDGALTYSYSLQGNYCL